MPVDFQRIRELREKKLLTLEEAATRAGWHSRVRWSDLEKGRYADPQLSTLESVCRALDCDLLDIIVLPPAAAKTTTQKRKRPSGAAGSKG